jgi:hypothetical protein
MQARKRRRLLILSGVLAVVVGGCYYLLIDRRHIHVENAGWVLDFSHIRLACPVCSGRIEKLTVDDRPLPLPHFPDYEENWPFQLATPVGRLTASPLDKRYRCDHASQVQFVDAGEPVTAEELARGYYDCSTIPGDNYNARRPGTPAFWCQVAHGGGSWWLDPRLIDQLDWSALAGLPTARSSSASTPNTATAPTRAP